MHSIALDFEVHEKATRWSQDPGLSEFKILINDTVRRSGFVRIQDTDFRMDPDRVTGVSLFVGKLQDILIFKWIRIA